MKMYIVYLLTFSLPSLYVSGMLPDVLVGVSGYGREYNTTSGEDKFISCEWTFSTTTNLSLDDFKIHVNLNPIRLGVKNDHGVMFDWYADAYFDGLSWYWALAKIEDSSGNGNDIKQITISNEMPPYLGGAGDSFIYGLIIFPRFFNIVNDFHLDDLFSEDFSLLEGKSVVSDGNAYIVELWDKCTHIKISYKIDDGAYFLGEIVSTKNLCSGGVSLRFVYNFSYANTFFLGNPIPQKIERKFYIGERKIRQAYVYIENVTFIHDMEYAFSPEYKKGWIVLDQINKLIIEPAASPDYMIRSYED